jgi:hypothetical protein
MGAMGTVPAGGLGAGALPAATVTFLFTDLEGSTAPQQAHPAAYAAALRRAGRRRLGLAPRRRDLLERGRLDPGRPLASGDRRLSAERGSRTAPDATLMSTATGGPAGRGSQPHSVVDGGRDRVILHALTTPGDVLEGQTLPDLLWRVRFRRRRHPRRAVGDSTHGTVANSLALEDAGLRASFPLADTARREGPSYPLAAFHDDADQDTDWGPQGHPLRRYRIAWAKAFVGYVADPAVCNACPVRDAGTPGTTGRHVHRSLHAEDLDRVRGYHGTESSKRAMRKRAGWVEPLFGEAKA